MKLNHLALAALVHAQATSLGFAFSIPNTRNSLTITRSAQTTTSLYGKLWDKLQIEPDTMEDEPGWYVMNCVAGSEMDLLAQAKHVCRDMPEELVEKITVPTERKLRSHGKTKKVVEVKVMYPGYCFVKMRCCADTYEPLQQLPLCRSWMAGTVNQKGYKKLPPAPICLSDEEVSKFKGLEEATSKMYEKYGEDYTGRGDDGLDLIEQYKDYEVDNMVKVLTGNFKGEDGVVKRLNNGQIMVRLFTYGNVLDQWFNVDEIRPMTDAEAMKGLGGPAMPVNQDEFDVSIGKKPRRRENNRTLRNDLNDSMGGGDGRRMRRQDRVNRGERGRDMLGRTDQEREEEEQNWRQFREDQRASQQQKRGDMWGIKERSSWDAGDEAATLDIDGKWKSGRQMRREKGQSVENAVSGDGEWDLFAGNDQDGSSESGSRSGEEDDFFNSLMSELSDTLDSPSGASGQAQAKDSSEDDFFNSLMSDLTDEFDDNPSKHSNSEEKASGSFDEDDFFASLEADLQDSLDEPGDRTTENSSSQESNDEDDFFASLEADLSGMLDDSNSEKKLIDDNLFNNDTKEASVKPGAASKAQPSATDSDMQDLNKLKVADLKILLKERGLKVSGKKSELIARLQS